MKTADISVFRQSANRIYVKNWSVDYEYLRNILCLYKLYSYLNAFVTFGNEHVAVLNVGQ